jgi:hypothetical protein
LTNSYNKTSIYEKNNFLLLLFIVTSSSIFFACKKENISGEIESTFDLSGKQAISENLTDDANNILEETTESLGLSGNKEPLICMGTASCATVTVSPGSFPKTSPSILALVDAMDLFQILRDAASFMLFYQIRLGYPEALQ